MVPVEHIFIEEIKKAEEQFNFFRTISNHVLSDLPVKEMAPALGFEPRTKWLTEAVFEPGNTLFSLKDRSF